MNKIKSSEILAQKTDYKELFYKLYQHKRWFIVSFISLIAVAFLFNKFTANVYKNQTTLLLQDQEKNKFLTGDNIMQGFGLFAGNQNIENEIGILQSFTLINDAIIQLNLEASFYQEKYLIGNALDINFLKSDEEIYRETPIRISIDKTSLQPIDLPFHFRIIDDKKIKIEAFGTDVPIYSYIEDDVMLIADTVSINGVYNFEDEIKG